ncbi:hypothetical protein AB0M02_45770 [Actinoplanes sp. NPDC051861]|uniref:hypothetical protein n=1 Tax=Actinoplanes sp. NPDC051861 TaxID=3155170 RepID=UPI0034216E3B
MTVQTPPEPGHYPTAPPWASPPAPAPAAEPAAPLYGGLVPPYGDPENKHGQLLVKFPEEVLASGRPEAPSWVPVVVLTFFFSLLGAVSAMRRAAKARRYGRNRAPYWIAFVTTFVVAGGFWTVLTSMVAVPYYLQVRQNAVTKVLQGEILKDGRMRTAIGSEISDPQCSPEDEQPSGGLTTYLCTFKLAEGGRASRFVRADDSGNWELTK